MRTILLSILAALFMSDISFAQTKPSDPNLPTLFIIGDSTVRVNTPLQQGWGDPIQEMFDRTKINVENHAIGGRSSRTFITEGRWDKVLAAAKPGDYVLIQFGHNDGGPLSGDNRERGSIRGIGDESQEVTLVLKDNAKETVYSYGHYMSKYVRDAKAKGMTPIICSLIPRLPKPPTTVPATPTASYQEWAREIATREGAHFIELQQLILAEYNKLTIPEVKAKYFCEADNTHTSPAGATLNAQCVVKGIRSLSDCELKKYLVD